MYTSLALGLIAKAKQKQGLVEFRLHDFFFLNFFLIVITEPLPT